MPSTRVLSGVFLPRDDLVEAVDDVAALEVARAEARVGREDERVERAVLERVLLDLEPDEAQRVGRVVRVAQRHLAVQRLRRRIERAVEIVVGALLPVLRSGRARAAAIDVAGRKIERREHRRVADTGRVETGRIGRLWRAADVARGLAPAASANAAATQRRDEDTRSDGHGTIGL